MDWAMCHFIQRVKIAEIIKAAYAAFYFIEIN